MRLIDADRLKAEIFKACMDNHFMPTKLLDCDDVTDVINNAPTIEERPKGEWVEESAETGALGIKYTWVKCSECGWSNSLVIPKNYCPNCGAKMNIPQTLTVKVVTFRGIK